MHDLLDTRKSLMEDLTDSPEIKANCIRSKLLLSIYGDCIKLNKVCKLKSEDQITV